MYSLPKVYGDKPFEAPAQSPMYSMRPYYYEAGNNVNGQSAAAPLDKSPLIQCKLNLDDAATKAVIDDLLSRQMLLMCRLNAFQERLLSFGEAFKTAVASAAPAVTLSGISNDIAVHFSLTNVPYTLFALVRLLVKSYPGQILVKLHTHSSLLGQSDLERQVNSLKLKLKQILGFEFDSNDKFLTRRDCKATFTFVLSESADKVLKNNEELQRLSQIATQCGLRNPNLEYLWNILLSPAINDDSKLIAELGNKVLGLCSTHFLNGSSPSLEDIVLWTLSVEEFYPRGRFFAPCLSGSQLLNAHWRSAISSFFAQ